jgi:hypothetical protein
MHHLQASCWLVGWKLLFYAVIYRGMNDIRRYETSSNIRRPAL